MEQCYKMLCAACLVILAIFLPLLLLTACANIDDINSKPNNYELFNISIFTLIRNDDDRDLIKKEIMKYHHKKLIQNKCLIQFGHFKIEYNFGDENIDEFINHIIQNKNEWDKLNIFEQNAIKQISGYVSRSNATLFFQQHFIDDTHLPQPIINDDKVYELFQNCSHDHIPIIVTTNDDKNKWSEQCEERNYLIINKTETKLYNFEIVTQSINKLLKINCD